MSAIYHLNTSGYYEWSAEDRDAVKAFLREHDIDPSDVPTGGGPLEVHVLPSGEQELRLWTFDLQDGKKVRCPNCPSCSRQKRITRIVKTALPPVAAAYLAPSLLQPEPS
jgi:hypothetical protein